MLGNVLVVEDNAALRATLGQALQARAEVRLVTGVAECAVVLETFRPALVLLDVDLADGDAFAVLRLLQNALPPQPVVIVMSGVASAAQAFELAAKGVRYYLQKPLELEELERAIERALQTPPDIEPFVRACVGHVAMPVIEERVRSVMVGEALARAAGNRRGAARLLSVSRQVLQHMLRKLVEG